jgi:5-oxoprolinase (ATP-hydrolysing)
MANAIRQVSVVKGFDPQDYVLVSFGGAAAQHCCAVADLLGMRRILDHPRSSILSAVGIRLADQISSTSHPLICDYDDRERFHWTTVFRDLEETTRRQLAGEGFDDSRVSCVRSLDLRYRDTVTPLTIHEPDNGDFAAEFSRQHQRLFGYLQGRPLEILAARVDAIAPGNRLLQSERNAPTNRRTGLHFHRDDLAPGDFLDGPSVVADHFTTVVVDPGWRATMLAERQLLIEKQTAPTGATVLPPKLAPNLGVPHELWMDPVELEIFNGHFSRIARQMGISLQRTSISVNVKERLDFSCAIFTNNGDLVVNAPHIPVHLGAMSETIKSLIRLNPTVAPGDVFVTNDPYKGGSHLPDVTVATPVFENRSDNLVFWVASRSHHAEIGGIAPGSMPAESTTLAEEGVLIENFKLIDRNCARFDKLDELLRRAPYPSRMPDVNLADIRAQVAANCTGQRALLELVENFSTRRVRDQMIQIQLAAEHKTRAALRQLPDGIFRFEDRMDNGATIRVIIEKHGDQLTIDFAGTDPVQPNNLNANSAIVTSAVMYVMRCLIREDIPLNAGVLKPVRIKIPDCFLNPLPKVPGAHSPAVAGGNVETSQRIVDVLLGALQLAAASQGTMNNWLVGDASFGYYETVGGGSGATAEGPGADAVHCHMSNTRLTDPEILETRLPVILREFAIRRESGGAGLHRGGSGMIREFEFTAPLTLSLLTNRRNTRPFGICGGEPGESGANILSQADGRQTVLEYQCQRLIQAGERLRLLSPGGGGYGLRNKS